MFSLLILFLFAIFPLGQLGRLPISFKNYPEVRLYVLDFLAGALLAVWGIWRALILKKRYELPRLGIPILLFSLVALLSLILASPLLPLGEIGVAGLYLLRWFAYAGLYFVFSDLKKHFKWLNWKNIKNYPLALGLATTAFGFIQYFLFPNLKPLEVYNWDPHFYRLVGTFLDPGFTGIILVLTIILLFEKLGENQAGKEKTFFLSLLAVVFLGLILTHSRASYLAYLVAFGVISLFKKNVKIFAIATAILMAVLLLMPKPAGEGGKIERTYSFLARITNWQQAMEVFKDHPLIGVGFNTYRYIQRNYGFLGKNWQENHAGAGVDSSLLFVLATTGLVGFITYLNLLIRGLWGRNMIIVAIWAGVTAHSFFQNTLFYPWVLIFLMISAAYKE